MNIKTSIIALSLLSTCALASQAQANEKVVNQIINNIVKEAVMSASNEIENQVEKSLLTASHLLSIDGQQILGTVTITDIAVTEKKPDQTKSETKRETETSEQS